MNDPLCIFLTQSLQPYSIDFFRALDGSLQRRHWRLLVLVGSRATYRPWKDMGIESDPLFTFVSGRPAPTWVQRLLGSSARDLILLPGSGIGKTLRSMGPDLLVVNERNPISLTAALWARRHQIPCLLSTDIGQSPPRYATTRPHLIYHRLTARLFSGLIARTKEAESAPIRPGSSVPVLAPHGIDTSKYSPSSGPSEGPFRFLFVGVLEARKGLDTLMAAARLLHAEGCRFELRVVGSGSWAPAPSDLESPWLSMGGFQDGAGLLREYQAAHAFVLPTREDTFGVVVHEAASCGLPLLVGKGAGACATLVLDGVSGFRLDSGDAPALAARMRSLLDDEILRASLGRGARNLALEWCATRSGERVAEWLLQFHRA